MDATDTTNACPFLKEVAMLYCAACPQRKLLPRNQVVSMGPCTSRDFTKCALYLDMTRRAFEPDEGTKETRP